MVATARFRYDMRREETVKLSTAVTISDPLCITTDEKKLTYGVRGIVTHHGLTAGAGHYTAYVRYRRTADYFWHCDGEVTGREETFETVPLRDALDSEPYLILYKLTKEEEM